MANDDPRTIHGFETFAALVRRHTGLDLHAYRPPQLARRLVSFMRKHSFADLAQAASAIRTDPSLLSSFIDILGINVTEFFRNPDLFAVLEELLRERNRRQPIKNLWSAGCSIGCEPYTLAIIMDKIAPAGSWRILATDIDREALRAAQEGRFQPNYLKNVPPEVLRKYFIRDGDCWRICDKIRRRVTFQRHDLLADKYPSDQDVVLCRNVLIYFLPEAKNRVISGLAASLKPDGILFLGGTETVSDPRRLSLEQIRPFFFRKLPASAAKAA